MENISGFGSRVRLRASVTFPLGFDITQFADDADGFDAPSMQISDKGMGLNGDLVVWNTANPIPLSLSLIPGSGDDRNMSILFEANRVGKGKTGSRDVITLTIVYPNGSSITYNNGVLTDGPAGKSIASSGRMKSNTYQLVFENKVES